MAIIAFEHEIQHALCTLNERSTHLNISANTRDFVFDCGKPLVDSAFKFLL